MSDTKAAKSRTDTSDTSGKFTTDEIDAMKERAQELKAAKKRGGKGDGEADLLAKIATMSPADRAMAEGVHAVIRASAPELDSSTWYGMPAYTKNGKVICFFQPADKFKAPYATFGFNPDANLTDGTMWPTSWALTKLTPANEATIVALVKKAVR